MKICINYEQSEHIELVEHLVSNHITHSDNKCITDTGNGVITLLQPGNKSSYDITVTMAKMLLANPFRRLSKNKY
jgi:hypothetical protein